MVSYAVMITYVIITEAAAIFLNDPEEVERITVKPDNFKTFEILSAAVVYLSCNVQLEHFIKPYKYLPALVGVLLAKELRMILLKSDFFN